MEIQKGNFVFREELTPLVLNAVDGIAIHHMAHNSWGEQEVHKYHYSKGWLGIAYNYFVRFDGTIVECRGLKQGAGVRGANTNVLSIGFQGDYDTQQTMPAEQYFSGVWLLKYLKGKVPTIKTIDGHKKWNPTACPGKYFPLSQMLEAVNNEVIIVDWKLTGLKQLHDEGIIKDFEGWSAKIDDPAPVWFVTTILNNIYKKLKGGE